MTKNSIISPPASYPFITISRQTGAGGTLLAKVLLAEMKKQANQDLYGGWQIFDGQAYITRKGASRRPSSLAWLKYERYRKEFEDMFYQLLTYQEPQVDVLGRLFKAIYQAAQQGKFIFIGRGAGVLCRGLAQGLRVRLVAPMETRIHRMAALSTLSRKAAEREIQQRDRSRTWFVYHYFGQDLRDPLLYHATFNTADLPVRKIAKLLISAVEQTYHKPLPQRPSGHSNRSIHSN